MKTKNYIVLLLLFVGQTVFSQVEFVAKASKKKLGVNQKIKLDFVMNKDGDNFTPPNFSHFYVAAGPSTSISNSWVNGVRSYSKTYTYFLVPKKKGTFTIKQATIEIDGQVYKTTPIKITVGNAVTDSAEQQAQDNIHLVATVSDRKPFLNEAIYVEYRLYFGREVSISNYQEINNPKYSDFWSQSIDIKKLQVKEGEYKGEDYRYAVLRKTVLYPQKTGKLTIEPLRVEIGVDLPTNRRDIFGGRVYNTVNKPFTANTLSINVQSLPENGKPASFSGAVGQFDFNVVTTKNALRANESLQAKVEVKGKGNLKLFDLPKLTTPNALEVYEPEHKEKVSTSFSGMQGRITDTYTIVPQYKGKYPIPSIEFSYFNPKTKQYKILNSLELQIDVLDGPTNNNASTVTENTNTNANQQVITTSDQFRYISNTSNFVKKEKKQFFKSTFFWMLLLLPFLAIPVLLIINRNKKKFANDVKGNKLRKADKLAKKFLSDAKKNLNEKNAFYESLHKSLHNYLKAKFEIETSEFSKEKINNLLVDKSVDDATNKEFLSLLESCEMARYSPITTSEMKNDYEKAVRLIAKIDNAF